MLLVSNEARVELLVEVTVEVTVEAAVSMLVPIVAAAVFIVVLSVVSVLTFPSKRALLIVVAEPKTVASDVCAVKSSLSNTADPSSVMESTRRFVTDSFFKAPANLKSLLSSTVELIAASDGAVSTTLGATLLFVLKDLLECD